MSFNLPDGLIEDGHLIIILALDSEGKSVILMKSPEDQSLVRSLGMIELAKENILDESGFRK